VTFQQQKLHIALEMHCGFERGLSKLFSP